MATDLQWYLPARNHHLATLGRPTDLRRMRPWVPNTDAVFREMLGVIGANGVTLTIGEVFGGLRTQMIDVVPGTAIAVAGLQWFTSVTHVTRQSDGKEAVVEFSLDSRAAGAGCYTV